VATVGTAEEGQDQELMAIITEEKKEEGPTPRLPLITVLTITRLTLKEDRLIIRAIEMTKSINLRAIHTMKAPTTKEDLLIIFLKNTKAPKEEVLLPMVTQKDIHQVVVSQHNKRILTMMRERHLENTIKMSIIKRNTTTMGKRTIQDRRHPHQKHRRSLMKSTTKNLIRSHQKNTSNKTTRQEFLIKEAKMDTKITITRKRRQHINSSTILITREVLAEATKINTLESPKIIRKQAITSLLVQILITNSKGQIKQHQRNNMARKTITINARKEGEQPPRVRTTIEDYQPKVMALTGQPPQSVAVAAILISNMEIITKATEMKKNRMNMTIIMDKKLPKRTFKIKK
jgi:hypothetical protein